jgi:hypothetical protein
MDEGRKSRALARATVFLGSTCGALAVAFAWSLSRPVQTTFGMTATLADPAARTAAIDELVSNASGVWDSHPDPDVARVLQPRLNGRELGGVRIRSNGFGIREKDWAMPKPPGLIRVVLLGDSFVFGENVTVDDRVGTFLEELLRLGARSADGGIECLSIGMGSWNILAECAWLRRTLSDLQPDLVLQVTCSNDLDDTEGVRGFGSRAGFVPRHRGRGDGRLSGGAPALILGRPTENGLYLGLDFESRQRYAEAADAIAELATEVERRGGRYVLVSHWATISPLIHGRWTDRLDPDQIAWIPGSVFLEPALTIGPGNAHWNRLGGEAIARFLYGMILERDLLPAAGLGSWPDARAAFVAIDEQGRVEAERELDPRTICSTPIRDAVDCARMELADANQIHGGVDRDGLVSPYASILLRAYAVRHLRVEGRCLERPELDGTRVRVFADEVQVGELLLESGRTIDEHFALPPELPVSGYLSARFEADDWALVGPDLQHTVVFRLDRVSVGR